MTTSEWQRLEELFHAALRLSGAERDDYLARECGADEALRREVESLVGVFESERNFIEQPALSLGMRVLIESLNESLVGRAVGHYKVKRLLGRGGMGEVYLAEDCVLERPVALKFIADGFVGDGWAREQLMREARAVARLEHSNICAVYGVDEADGHSFIVMQYVEGETLSSLLRRGPLGVERSLDLATQMVGALSAAHERGVVHGDIKPHNIIVTADGQVKVLDFGLAKFVRQRSGAEGEGDPGQTLQAGAVVGTPAYMSPEQTRGEDLDQRSDIFSFGVILYEMLAGDNPFLRDTVEDTTSAICAEDPPPLAASLRDAPEQLEFLVRRCLARQREERAESADLLLRELRSLREPAQGRASRLLARVTPTRRHMVRLAAAALALVCLLLVAAGFVYVKASRVHTLAVLPIVNQSGDDGADYLSEGLTRDLFDKFSYLPRLRLRLPSTVPPDRTERADLAGIGRELKADAVLAGQIFKQGDSLRLHLSLLDTADASQTWDATFDLDSANVFALQDDITREVTSGLGLWLIGDERRLLTKHQTSSQEALDLYMRARYYLRLNRDRETLKTAIRLFEQAVELDRSFAKAYAGLAECYAYATKVAYGPLPAREAMEKARWNARLALESDDSLAETHTSAGIVRMWYYSDWQQAKQEFMRAIELDPDYAPAHYWYSALLSISGRFDESVKQSEIARSLDPYSQLAAMNHGRALYFARRGDEAAGYLRKLLEHDPDFKPHLQMMGLVLLQQGRNDEAVAVLERLYSLDRIWGAASLGYAYGKTGRRDDALRMLGELEQTPEGTPAPPIEKAIVYIGMGDRDRAFSALEEVYKEQPGRLVFLTTDSIYDDLRPDPRFADLARRLNLVP
jgi:serine/threonine protein kinase/TolB-like protein/Tfp pilus assembly protein PilF